MAEAVVEDPNRFFCHKCSREMGSVLPDYTCPSCRSGFIEALDGQSSGGDAGEDSEEDIDVVQPWEILNDVLFMGMNGDPLVEPRRQGRGRRGRDGERRPGRNNRARHSFENLMHLFVMNLNADLGGIGNLQGGRGGALGHEFFVGNPGDYAWGREGFDAIVTQLLNQIESTGPPPLAKEKILEIPIVSITKEQVDKSLQCSVCWESFKLDEPVRQLMCTHVYHEGCIIPWLELHGTCPVCRQPLSPEAEQAPDDGNRGARETLRNLAAQLNPLEATASQSRADQLRQINRQMEELRSRYNNAVMGNSSSGSGSTSSGSQTGVDSTPTTSSTSDSSTSTSSTSTGTSSSHGNLEDMDVD